MDAAAVAGLCAVLAQGHATGPLPEGVVCPPAAAAPAASVPPALAAQLAPAIEVPAARDGIARVAFAEAGNQGDTGLAAVVYAILNRLADGRWGGSVDSVLNARGQFEPVLRAGGDWRNLPPVTAAQQARVDTILDLALDGRLPDLTRGALYFQNPAIVARRARDGVVSPRLVNFGGATPTAVIGAHSFYLAPGRGGGPAPAPRPRPAGSADDIFVGDNRAAPPPAAAPAAAASAAEPVATARLGDPAQAMFVSRDGAVNDGRR
jgi:N-acetylmuramoyl-L-alanine amidase